MSIDYTTLPEHMQDAAKQYCEGENPAHPGDFLKAVLSNDFVGAFRYADPDNQQALEKWAQWLRWEVPMTIWGSREVVEAHLRSRADQK
jgi:histidinol-phosphate/aromatic aminotransferase/cobyric acid decarboxylase-like protein